MSRTWDGDGHTAACPIGDFVRRQAATVSPRLPGILERRLLAAVHAYMQLAKLPPSGWQHNQPLEDAWMEVVRAYRVWLAWKEGRVRE